MVQRDMEQLEGYSTAREIWCMEQPEGYGTTGGRGYGAEGYGQLEDMVQSGGYSTAGEIWCMEQSEGYGTTGGRGVWCRGIWHNHRDMVQLGAGVGMVQSERYGTTRRIWYSQRDMEQLEGYSIVREIW